MFLPHRRAGVAVPAALLAAVFGVLLAGVPAQAAEAGPALHMTVSQEAVGLPQPAHPDDPAQISWGVSGDPAGGTAQDVVVKIDVSGISSFTDVDSGDCTDGVCAWPAQDIASNGFEGGILDMNAKAGVPLGTTGTARVYATSADATVSDVTVKVTVGTVGLVVGGLEHESDGVRTGTTLDAPLTVANNGSLPAQGVDLRLAATQGLGLAARFANCVDGSTDDVGESEGRTLDDVVCHIDTPVLPGVRYRLSAPVGVSVRDTALFDFVDYSATLAAAGAAGKPSTGAPVLGLVPDGTAPSSGSDETLWIVNAANTADMAVTGQTVTARPGDRVTLTAHIRDNGPATVDLLTSDDQPGLRVSIPKGTTAVAVPEACRPWTGGGMGEPALGAPVYMCFIGSPFEVGQALSLPFTLEVGKDAPATTRGGLHDMSVNGGELAYDADQSNSTGYFTVHVTEPASAPAGGPSASPGTKPAGTHVSATAAHHVTTDGVRGSLAATGTADTEGLVSGALVAVAAGSCLLTGVRRRRGRTS